MSRNPTSASAPAVIALSLALAGSAGATGTSLGLASPTQTATLAQATQRAQSALDNVTIRDVPADHWAAEAVRVVTKCGVITGFPDGTFRGDLPLTRYQAALILARALPELWSCGLGQADQATLTKGLESLQPELRAIQAQIAQLAKTQADQQQQITAIQQQLAGKGSPTSPLDPSIIQQQLQMLSDLLMSQQAQLAELRQGRGADSSKIAALEKEIASLRTQLDLLGGSYATLGTKVDTLQVQQASAALGTAPVAATTPTQVDSAAAPVQNVAGQPDVAFTPNAEVPSSTEGHRFSVGAYAAIGGIAKQFGAQVDVHLNKAPVYLQVYGVTSLGGVNASGLGLNAVYDFGKAGQDLRPYAYVGGGVARSEAWNTTGSAVDFYGRVGAGAEYRMANTFSLFGDVYGTYYFSNKGIGTGLPQAATSGPSFGGRAGVKISF